MHQNGGKIVNLVWNGFDDNVLEELWNAVMKIQQQTIEKMQKAGEQAKGDLKQFVSGNGPAVDLSKPSV
ncbi:MAG: hypothetical protein KGO96_07710 [Elusimicrobia bacterium]|nr:hypothetical protein [Elusimicrobiota bacterium]